VLNRHDGCSLGATIRASRGERATLGGEPQEDYDFARDPSSGVFPRRVSLAVSENPMSASNPASQETAGLVRKNIQSLLDMRRERDSQRTREQRFADAVREFVGNMRFAYLWGAIIVFWVTVDFGWFPGIPRFDPYPYPLLATMSSLAALFLSTFILVSQNRMTELADQRAELNVQISLLAEHEVTQLIHLVESIAIRVGARQDKDPLLDELKQHVDPLQVIKEIDMAKEGMNGHD
jgi:uncharacterized membrane protein